MSTKTQLSTEYNQKKNSKKKILVIILAIILLITSATLGLGYTIAKYANSLEDDYHYIDAKDFFFTSDYLKADFVPTYTIYNFKSNHSVTFNVYNYADNLSITPDTITFTASTTGGSITSGAQTLAGGSQRTKQITLTATSAGTYTVTVAASSPYSKTLSANFKFVEYEAPNVEYGIVDHDDYVELNIGVGSHKDDTCSVTLAWDSVKFILDTNNTAFSSVSANTNYKTAIGSLKTGASYQVILYKKTLNSPVPTKASSAAATANANKVYVGITG